MEQYKTLNDEIYGLAKNTNYPQNWPIHNCCPCCSSTRIKYYFDKFNYTHWKCSKCNFVFLNPYPNNQVSELLYNGDYFNAVRKFVSIPKAKKGLENANTSMALNFYYEIIDYITKLKSDGAWLDVGGGIGTFLHIVNKRFPLFKLYLNESNKTSAEFAKKYYGLEVLSTTVDSLKESGKKFDIITSNAVLEHISHPRKFIHDYYKLLKPDGILLLNIPHYTTLNRLLSRQHTPNVIPPSHISFFNKKNIKHIINELEDVKQVKIWDTGEAAFQFIHIARISEVWRIKIPNEVAERIDSFMIRQYNRYESISIRLFSMFDKYLSKIVKFIDGGIYINIAVIKKDNSF